MNWSPSELDRVEAAIVEGARMQLVRRGTEFVVIPQRLESGDGSEVLLARHPTTGEEVRFALDEIEEFVVLP
ncbi:MAG: hypothetical protein M3409_01220 [Gemmatimonadota bacterium]|nr:hypothetical protein [Gemmatimonadota bacterium]